MPDKKNGLGTKILVAVTFVLMVTVNTMAVILPINGEEQAKFRIFTEIFSHRQV